MKVHVIGSGTLLPDSARGAPAHLMEVGSSAVLMDCGSGTLRTLARLGLSWEGLTHVLLTHFHTDHVADLAPLLFALKHGLGRSREDPLRLWGPLGLGAFLRALSRAHGPYILDPGFPLVVEELSPGDQRADSSGDFSLFSFGTHHTDGSLAFRIETDDGVLGFTGDTGPMTGLGAFFRGCDVLLAECSHPDGEGRSTHLTPLDLVRMAGIASPEILVTLHAYPPLDPDEVPDLLGRAGYQGRVVAGRDGLSLRLDGGTVLMDNA